MRKKIDVLIVGRSASGLQSLYGMLRSQPDIKLAVRQIDGSISDPLYGVETLPEILVVQLDNDWTSALEAIMARPANKRPVLLATGPEDNVWMMRMAMKAGARDYLTEPVAEKDLMTSMRLLVQEHTAKDNTSETKTTVLINAKGGSGATLLTCNLGHVMAEVFGLRTVAIDMDLQFGSMPHYLDMTAERSLAEALSRINSLDSLALQTYMSKHPSGLHVLSTIPNEIAPELENSSTSLRGLLRLIEQSYESILIDLPHKTDRFNAELMEIADQVLVVMQQTSPSLRECKYLLMILQREWGIPQDKIRIVVNRFENRSLLSLDDIRHVLGCREPYLVHNDFRHVTESVNTGVPLYEAAKDAAITKDLVDIASQLTGMQAQKKPGLIKRTLARFEHRA